MPNIIFDIETIGENFESLDKTTQDILKEDKDKLGLSPLTGEIVAIGVLDSETNKGAVYYQSPKKKNKDFEKNKIKFRAMPEKQMLEKFWQIAKNAEKIIGFNSRSFDAPFIIVRSAVHKINPTVNLMPYRYAQNTNHIDLLEHLSFYGAMQGKKSLHLWCHALDIESPKVSGVKGDNVAELFNQKKYLDIARYNVRDLYATRDLYKIWQKYIKI